MSYTIEYDRQFVESNLGITPCWCAGENNVTTGQGRHERRVRDWGVFYNLLGATEEQIIEAVQPSLGGYNEHWRKNGKWVDDAGLLRWIHNGCKNAASIEDILAANNRSGVPVKLSVWTSGLENSHELERLVTTTEEFDAWIGEAKSRIEEIRAEKGSAYPIVAFWSDTISHPKPVSAKHPEYVLLKHGKRYMYECNERGSSWTTDATKAMVFSYDDAKTLQKEQRYGHIAEAILVNAAIKDEPFDCVLRFADGRREGYYVQNVTKGNMNITLSAKYAKHYRNYKTAEEARKKLQLRYSGGTLEIVNHAKQS